MKPTFVDIHIHTGETANSLPENYNVKKLVENVRKIAKTYEVLLSLSDHNTINKSAYLNLVKENVNVLISAELHIKKYDDAPPYHCHIIFNCDVNEESIDNLNTILDTLYPDKIVSDSSQNTLNTPNIEQIINAFDSYEFLLLPHGGQSHRTFDKATSKLTKFDTSMEKSIYYNHFDGFTSRSISGLEDTVNYFKKLGISEFINLVTCTDNYNPEIYPKTKAKNAEDYVPTWMLAEPSFDGLRLSLSEPSRLHYDTQPPQKWTSTLGSISLSNDKIEIDVRMTPGLNVVIGGSSTGKTLFVDSLMRGIKKDFKNTKYRDFFVDKICIENPSNVLPHYLGQNFIMSVLNDSGRDLGEIPIIDRIFPEDQNIVESIRNSLVNLEKLINKLTDSAEKLENLGEDFAHIPELGHLIINETIRGSIIEKLSSSLKDKEQLSFSESKYNNYRDVLVELKELFEKHPILGNKSKEIDSIIESLNQVLLIATMSNSISKTIGEAMRKQNMEAMEKNKTITQIKDNRKKMVGKTYEALRELISFHDAKNKLEKFDVEFKTQEIEINGYKLSIKNSFKLTEEQLVEAVNNCLKKEYRIQSFTELKPEIIQKKCFLDRPKISDHNALANYVHKKVHDTNKKEYQIITKEGENYNSLSPGWKTAVILDLVLSNENDSVPIIIDQPEDNLATSYINNDLIETIKRIKENKQVILVSHNATIPMLGDAQNVIVCKNDGSKITIKSAALESSIDGDKTLDLIAELTDGGKSSIKKRVKKYNFKSYRGEKDEA